MNQRDEDGDILVSISDAGLAPHSDGELFIAALSIIFAALCIWLGVRIMNRHERWAKKENKGHP